MKHIGNNTEEAALKKSNLGYVLVLIAALMWGSIGIFVNGIAAMGVSSPEHGGLSLVGRSAYLGAGSDVYGLPSG